MPIYFKPGSLVRWKGDEVVILEVIDLHLVRVLDVSTKIKKIVPVSEITSNDLNPEPLPDLQTLKDKDWYQAEKVMDLLRDIARAGPRKVKLEDVQAVAVRLKCSTATVYRKLKKIRQSKQVVSSLVRKKRTDQGRKRLSDELEQIIADAMEEYKTYQRLSITDINESVKVKCAEKRIKPPHINTLRNRIKEIPLRERDASRFGEKYAEEQYEPLRGHIPNADFPLAIMQIDHTPVDLILVDDVHRLPIARAFLTIAIDVFSKMILGFYLSLDNVGILATGMCIARAMCPKEEWLKSLEIDGDWPCWGKPLVIHTDNGKEFHSEALKKGCLNYDIDLVKRPKRKARYGGDVERAFRTFMSKTHSIKGTTFSSVHEKGEYDSEANSSMTLSEYEKWFAIYVMKVYNNTYHEGIYCPPIHKWREGLMGTDQQLGIGLPDKYDDENKVRLDFMPMEQRTIQRYGVRINHVCYFHDILKLLINSEDPEKVSDKKKYIFRYDPRDMSKVWFYDEVKNKYHEIPYYNLSHPPVSYWEIKEAKKKINSIGKSLVDEKTIFEGIIEMRQIQKDAAYKTKSARKSAQKLQEHEKVRKPSAQKNPIKPLQNHVEDEAPVSAFDNLEDYQ